MEEKLTFANGTTICWEWGLDGGGSTQYLDFLPIVKLLNKKYSSGLEWCSGLGAVGFSVLDANLSESMAFMDLYEPCVYWTDKNAKENNLTDRVQFFLCDAISKLPIDKKYDLVLGNPPHCFTFDIPDYNVHEQRLLHDDQWKIHIEFFSNIKNYLLPGADILLSQIEVHPYHIELAEEHGLKYIKSYKAPILSSTSTENSSIMHYIYPA